MVARNGIMLIFLLKLLKKNCWLVTVLKLLKAVHKHHQSHGIDP